MKTTIIVFFSFVLYVIGTGSGGNPKTSAWKAEFFTDYSGVYDLDQTEGKISKVILTPYETFDGRKLLSILKIESDQVGDQPRYEVGGDLSVDLKQGVLRTQNGEKWMPVRYLDPKLDKEFCGININGVLYRRILDRF